MQNVTKQHSAEHDARSSRPFTTKVHNATKPRQITTSGQRVRWIGPFVKPVLNPLPLYRPRTQPLLPTSTSIAYTPRPYKKSLQNSRSQRMGRNYRDTFNYSAECYINLRWRDCSHQIVRRKKLIIHLWKYQMSNHHLSHNNLQMQLQQNVWAKAVHVCLGGRRSASTRTIRWPDFSDRNLDCVTRYYLSLKDRTIIQHPPTCCPHPPYG